MPTNPVTAQHATWQGGGATNCPATGMNTGCELAVPAKSPTLGLLKSLCR